MLKKISINFYYFSIKKTEQFTASKLWLVKSALLISLIAFFTSFPDYHWYMENHDTVVFEALDWQIAHPFQQLPDKYTTLPEGVMTGTSSHLDKRWSRITVPLIAYVLGLDTFGCIILQHITSILFFYLLLKISYSFTRDKVDSLLIGGIFAFIPVGKWGGYDFFCYDGIAYFLMLVAMWRKNPVLIFFGILLAAFTDERALIASSLIYLWWHIRETGLENVTFKSFFKFYASTLAILGAWVSYFLIRYFVLVKYFHLSSRNNDIGLEVLIYNFKYIPMGFFTYLEFAWILIILAYLILFFYERYTLILFLLIATGISQGIAFFVYDVSRSMMYSFPVLLISIYIIHKNDPKNLRAYLLAIMAGCFLLPTHAVFVDGVQWLSPIFPKILKLF